ncbi:leucine-rich repeat-containing protein 61 isoform X2 [Octopus sinensis]|uniref:Leucine-rich repeat-containing protein 61 isoform X2 n=1 Tax=Octopus sinensis TaxID=2607531 RepID=A0A7E6FDF6_9MOLL|nr:leucine-rich repeat-containing protein 61 isoform X2 [Octopus sinensis]
MFFKRSKVTSGMLRGISGDFDLESIMILNLDGLHINEVGSLEECTGLEHLILSNNDLSNLIPVSSLTNLNSLNLSNNNISSLEGLQTLENLETLNLSGNFIENTNSLYCLTGLPKLKHLLLQCSAQKRVNPVCQEDLYQDKILNMFQNLESLDGNILYGACKELNQLVDELDSIVIDNPPEQIKNLNISEIKENLKDFEVHPSSVDFEKAETEEAENHLKVLLGSCQDLIDGTKQNIKPLFTTII